ncbi:MAG: cytochrome c biogenesis protein CcsA [Planctomycetota bacterium]
MTIVLSVLNWLLPLLYLALLIESGTAFFLRRTKKRNLWLLLVIGLHAGFLVLHGVHLGGLPLANTFDIMSVLALCTGAIYCGIEFASRDSRIDVFILPLVFLFQYTASIFLAHTVGTAGPAELATRVGWSRLHIVPAVMAYSGFTIAAVYGGLHLRARSNLKNQRFGLLFDRLPSLDVLGRVAWYALVAGFAFMTVAVATGAAMSFISADTAAVELSPLRIASMALIGSAAWLAYLAAIVGRSLWHWPASRVSAVAVNGFLALVLLLAISAVMP